MSDKYGIMDVVKQFLSGTLKFASDDIVASRRATCKTCEVRNTTLNTCTICSCYIPAKTKLLNSSCPMEKW